jgi:hypothetical protein
VRGLIPSFSATSRRLPLAARGAVGHLGAFEAHRLLLEQDVPRFDHRPFDQHQRALQQVVELADVAGPRVREQQVGRVGRQRRDAFAGSRAHL